MRQVAFGKLEDDVARMGDEPHAGLEQPLREARRQGPALNGERQDELAQKIAERL
jgi:hypothetical protein